MKFAVFALLFSTATAVRLSQHAPQHKLVKAKHAQMFKKFIKAKQDDSEPDLSSGEEDEIEAWATKELTTGEGTITKDEAHDFFAAFAKKHGYKMTKEDWEGLEEMFDDADTNHDGELDLDEVVAACGGDEEIKLPKNIFFKKLLKTKDDGDISSGEEDEIEAWATKELTTGDKTITKKEAHDFFAGFAKKHGYKMTKDDWDQLEAMFDAADTNHDGEIDLDELMAACGEDELKLPIRKLIKSREGPDLDSEEEGEIEKWATDELTTGDKTITKKEAHDFFAAFAKKHGYKMTKADWKGLEDMFDAADTNHDGEIDVAEMQAACGGEDELKLPKKFFKKLIKAKDDGDMSSGEENEIEAWATKELTTGDKTITKKEAHDFFAGFAKKHGYKMTKDDWAQLEAMFDAADTNHDGEIDVAEMQAAMGGSDLKLPKKQLLKKFKKLIKAKQDGPDSEEEDEIEAWATKELTTGDKTITKKEAHDFFAKFAKKHGYKMTKDDWAQLEAMFDAADTNHDGEIDLDELQAAMGDSDLKLPKKFVKKYLKTKAKQPELDSEDEEEIEDWVEHELTTGDKTITKKEAHDAIAAFAKKKGWKIPKEAWDAMEEAFDEADTNGDGELDLDEVMAACEGMDEDNLKKLLKSKKMLKKFVKSMRK